MKAVRCIVAGRVQGVWFRDTTRRRAIELGLTGSARNLPDGTVEVIAYGSAGALETLKTWLWEGSRGSQVNSVECEALEGSAPSRFVIG